MRWILEGTWSGYHPRQERVVHRAISACYVGYSECGADDAEEDELATCKCCNGTGESEENK